MRATQMGRRVLGDGEAVLGVILLGGGERIFPDGGQARPPQLVPVTTAGTGVLIRTCRRVRR